MGMRAKQLSGLRFGRLTVISRIGTRGSSPLWLCKCDCGNEKIINSSGLGNKTQSCGCLYTESRRRTRRIHGMFGTPTYNSWARMLDRCYNPKNNRYHRYGGRGIHVAEHWSRFENFMNDMGCRPDGTSIERVDNDGNYEPTNCRWATAKQQANNRTRSQGASIRHLDV